MGEFCGIISNRICFRYKNVGRLKQVVSDRGRTFVWIQGAKDQIAVPIPITSCLCIRDEIGLGGWNLNLGMSVKS